MTTHITPQQKQKAAVELNERWLLKRDCDHNRIALVNLRRDINRETGLQKKCDMENEYTFAKALIIEKEEKLAALKNPYIANKVGITIRQLKHFDMATTNNWREQV